MKRTRTFRGIKFPVAAIKEAVQLISNTWGDDPQLRSGSSKLLRAFFDTEDWDHDDEDEFFSDYSRNVNRSYYTRDFRYKVDNEEVKVSLGLDYFGSYSVVSASGPERRIVERIVGLFEDWEGRAEKVHLEGAAAPVVFVGHGRSSLWRDLKDHLRDKHHLEVVAYGTGARAGHSIRDILDELVESSSFALLVMTAEDASDDGTLRARQNVVHEVGLFQGKLGFSRAIALVEDGVEVFSNLDGVQQIRFSGGNIKETFGDVLATIRREFS